MQPKDWRPENRIARYWPADLVRLEAEARRELAFCASIAQIHVQCGDKMPFAIEQIQEDAANQLQRCMARKGKQ